MEDWNKIGLMAYSDRSFASTEIKKTEEGKEIIRSAPFDDRTLVVTSRQQGKESTLSVYTPEYYVEALKGRPEGAALREAENLFFRVFGQLSL